MGRKLAAVCISVLIFSVLAYVPCVYADSDMDQSGCTSEAINSEAMGYEQTPVNKLSRGVINTATCWAEIPADVARVSKATNPIVGVTYGAVQGLFTGVVRGLLGVVDVATFFIPPYDKPLMEPEYAYERADKNMKDYLW
jgi:putative exosortase-associated protein (TIGR04073 family)